MTGSWILTSRIALRYLFSRKSHSAVNIISAVSVGGIAVATMALVVVLSVFNGFNRLIESRLSRVDPVVAVLPSVGKTIANADSLAERLKKLPQVAQAVPTVSEQALVMIGDYQMPVHVTGVPEALYPLIDSVVIAGESWHDFYPGVRSAMVSVGVANSLNLVPGSEQVFAIYVPRRLGRVNPANPLSAFRADSLAVCGVYSVGQAECDGDMIYIPLESLRGLLQYTTEASAVAVAPAHGVSESQLKKAVADAVGEQYQALTRREQHASTFRVVNMEKWSSFLLLGFIVIVASFNIISTMALLILEKSANASILLALGASRSLVRRIYVVQGWMITLIGGVVGIGLGMILSVGQQHFGWVKLNGAADQLALRGYPVCFNPADLLPIAALVALIGAVTAMVASHTSR